MRFAFVLAEKAVWPVSVMCEVLEVSRSGYYAWQGRPASAREQADGELVVEINAAHKAGRGHYSSPRVHRALRQNGRRVGKKVGHQRAQRPRARAGRPPPRDTD